MKPLKTLCVALLLAAGGLPAQEFHPYADAKISAAEWQSYLADVRSKLGASERTFPEDHLTVFEDAARQTYYAFTTAGHPAHPAWVARRVYRQGDEVGTEQTGYYAGDVAQFESLYNSYKDLTRRMQGEEDRELPPEAYSDEARAHIEELTHDFLIAHDVEDYDQAYAMLTPVLQKASPYTEWRSGLAAALARSGTPHQLVPGSITGTACGHLCFRGSRLPLRKAGRLPRDRDLLPRPGRRIPDRAL
jgi:chitodextrinase